MSPSQGNPHRFVTAERPLRLLFASTVAAAYVVFLIAAPQEFARPQGITLFVLGAVYAFIGTFGDTFREQFGTRSATITYFAIQLSLVAAYGAVSQAIGVFWLVPLPLVSQAVVILPRLGIAAVAAAVVLIVAAVGSLNVEPREAMLSTVTYLVAVAFVIGFSYLVVRERRMRAEVEQLAAKLREANLQLEAYAAQADELAAARERNHLARELHDSATQTAFSIKLTTEAAQMMLDRDSSQVSALLQRLQDLSQDLLTEMRMLIGHLRLPDRRDELLPALQRCLNDLRIRQRVTVDLTVDGEPHMAEDQAEGLSRIAQEALNNVGKHASATSAKVLLQRNRDRVCLIIEDDGVGFDPHQAIEMDGHYGILGMQERAQILGAKLSVASVPGEGTRVTVELPLERKGDPGGDDHRADR